MSSFKDLFQSDSFIKMCTTIGFWLVLYIIVKLFTIQAGSDDLLRVGTKRIVKLRKLTRQFRILCTAKGAYKNIARGVKLLKKIVNAEKKATRLLTMYLFDDRGDLDVAGAKDVVVKIPDVCRDALMSIVDKKEGSLVPLFDQADADLKEALALLHKAAALDKKKELLQIND